MRAADLPELPVPHVSINMTSLWCGPTAVSPTPLLDSSTGENPRLQTEVAVFRSDERLQVLFSMEDDEVVATMLRRDDPLWNEDVVEIFLAPVSLDRYFEIEISPRGTIFDATVRFPGPDRSTMSVDSGWNCEGLWCAVRRMRSEEGHRAEIIVNIPFRSLGGAPSPGEVWRANFYRIDRSSKGDSFMAWSPTLATPPDFHVPSRFGSLYF